MPLFGDSQPTTDQLVARYSGEFDLPILSDSELLLIARNSLYSASLNPLEEETGRRHNKDHHDQSRRLLYRQVQAMAAMAAADPTVRESKDKLDEDFFGIMAKTYGQGSQKRK